MCLNDMDHYTSFRSGFRKLTVLEVESSIKTLAAHAKVSDSYFTAVLRLAWLAPDITQALLAGRHPPELNVVQLMKHSRHLPLEWAKQRGLLKLDRA